MGAPREPQDHDPTSPVFEPRELRRDRPGLEPGTVVARRYRIVRFLGGGGMGEVYEAEDAELGGRVALKAIRPDLVGPGHLQRFKREIQLARQVTHPNVARTFDVGYHERGGAAAPLTFLTMELLPGETLAARLRRGRMSVAEVLSVARGIAAGLAAAHAAGVVHRDLKPGNVMLVPGDPGPRVVVTDFGLAHSPHGDDSATESGMVGSPAYMAPEQVTQGAVTPASDVYAFGVVLYEMVTGVRPFGEPGDVPLLVALKRLGRRPPSPRQHVPGLDARVERLVLACLEPDPRDRPGSGAALVDALREGGDLPPSRRSRSLVAATVVLAAAIATAIGLAPRYVATPAPALAPRAGVALLGFKNLSGREDTAWLSTALVEMLTSELSVGERLRLVPAETVERVKVELALPDAPTLASGTLERLHANLGADVVITGAYLALGPGGALRLDVRAQRTGTGETLPAVVETGAASELATLVARAGAALRAQLGETGSAVVGPRSAALPTDPEAARLYAEGLRALRRFDALAARERLEEAASIEPDHPLPHLALSEALSALGYDERAATEAARALEGAHRLSGEQRLLAEGRAAETARDWEKAADAYRLLWRSHRDTLEYGLLVAHALTAGGRGGDALEVVADLRRLRAPSGDDARVDLAEAAAANALWDLPRLKTAAGAAAEKGRRQQAPLLRARALLLQLHAAANMGEWERIAPAFEEARRIHEHAGHRPGLAATLHQMAAALDLRGDRAAARPLFVEALAIRREIGDRSGTARTINGLGWLEQQEGRPKLAAPLFEEAVRIARELNDRGFVSVALNNLSISQKALGRRAEARRSLEEAVVLARETGQKVPLARALNNLAWASLSDSDVAGAGERYAEAISAARDAQARYPLGYGLAGLAYVRRAEGRFAEAETLLREAIEVGKGTREEAHARLSLASVLLDEGRVADAAALVDDVARTSPVTGADWDAAHTAVHLAEVRMAQRRLDEAAALLHRSNENLSRLAEGHARFELLAARARLALAGNKVSASLLRELADGVTATRRERLTVLTHELELLLGQAEIAAGRREDGRVRLRRVEQSAASIGLGHTASEARRSLG